MLLLRMKEIKIAERAQRRRDSNRKSEQKRRAEGKVPPKAKRTKEQRIVKNEQDRNQRMKKKAKVLSKFLLDRQGRNMDEVALEWLCAKGIRN